MTKPFDKYNLESGVMPFIMTSAGLTFLNLGIVLSRAYLGGETFTETYIVNVVTALVVTWLSCLALRVTSRYTWTAFFFYHFIWSAIQCAVLLGCALYYADASIYAAHVHLIMIVLRPNAIGTALGFAAVSAILCAIRWVVNRRTAKMSRRDGAEDDNRTT